MVGAGPGAAGLEVGQGVRRQGVADPSGEGCQVLDVIADPVRRAGAVAVGMAAGHVGLGEGSLGAQDPVAVLPAAAQLADESP